MIIIITIMYLLLCLLYYVYIVYSVFLLLLCINSSLFLLYYACLYVCMGDIRAIYFCFILLCVSNIWAQCMVCVYYCSVLNTAVADIIVEWKYNNNIFDYFGWVAIFVLVMQEGKTAADVAKTEEIKQLLQSWGEWVYSVVCSTVLLSLPSCMI